MHQIKKYNEKKDLKSLISKTKIKAKLFAMDNPKTMNILKSISNKVGFLALIPVLLPLSIILAPFMIDARIKD